MNELINFLKTNDFDFDENVDGKKLCSFRVGGNVRVVVRPKNASELEELYEFLYENEIKNILLGRGSNVVISDDGYDGVVVSLRALSSVDSQLYMPIMTEILNFLILNK